MLEFIDENTLSEIVLLGKYGNRFDPQSFKA
jgi:hypothetical protein